MPHLYTLIQVLFIILYSVQYHRQHNACHVFEQFGALYMDNLDDKKPSTWVLSHNCYECHKTGYYT